MGQVQLLLVVLVFLYLGLKVLQLFLKGAPNTVTINEPPGPAALQSPGAEIDGPSPRLKGIQGTPIIR